MKPSPIPPLDEAAMLAEARAILPHGYGAPYAGLPLNCAVATARVLAAGGVALPHTASIAPTNPMYDEAFRHGLRATQLGPFALEKHGAWMANLAFRPVDRDAQPKRGRDLLLHHHMPRREPVNASEHVLPLLWEGDVPFVLDVRPSARRLLPLAEYLATHADDLTYGPPVFHLGGLEDEAAFTRLA